MKKLKNYFTSIFGLVIFLSFFVVGCQVGLGVSVDIEAPTIEVNSHRDYDSVSGSFVLQGTASDNQVVAGITIDCIDADMHFQITPGGDWQLKNKNFTEWENVESDQQNYCRKVGESNSWNWSVVINTENKAVSKTDNNFLFNLSVKDSAGNTGRKSNTNCTIIVDTISPSVSVYKPELFTGSYAEVVSNTTSYEIKDGNVISRLMNGNIEIRGRQTGSIAFKELRVEFDNGELNSTVRKYTGDDPVYSMDDVLSLEAAELGDPGEVTTYFSKNITGGDLRDWSLTVKPEDWIVPGGELSSGKHIIRVVTTSLSNSNTWERKVVGYFIWYPEADKPWISVVVGDKEEINYDDQYECYPGSSIPGSVQDDDGIKSVTSQMYHKNTAAGANGEFVKYGSLVTHELPTAGGVAPKYSAWNVTVPSEKGVFYVELTVKDINGNEDTVRRYFKTKDIQAPVINITSPLDNSCSMVNAEGTITLKGNVNDDGVIDSFYMVWLNPKYRTDSSNKIKYMTGSGSDWNSAISNLSTEDSFYRDTNGNYIYRFSVGGSSNYNFTKSFNLFSDFGIDGKDGKVLATQEFIFRASDGTTNSIKTLSLSGDSVAPELSFKDITISGLKQSLNGSEAPTFPKITSGTKAHITGTWSDMFTSGENIISNKKKILPISITWKNGNVVKTAEAVHSENGTWYCDIEAPVSGGTITAQISDFGGNKRTVQAAARIETSVLGLARVNCKQDDGSYKQGEVLDLVLEFTKPTKVDVTNGTPKLKLKDAGYATYDSGSGTTSHVYKYTVGGENIAKLRVESIIANGAKWTDAAVTEGGDLTEKITIENLPENLDSFRNISIDNTKPRIEEITCLSAPDSYKENATLLFMLKFTEDVTLSYTGTLKEHFSIGFTHEGDSGIVKTSDASETGSKYVLFTYNVGSGENVSPLTFDQVNLNEIDITDVAGNKLENIEPTKSVSFSGIIIDTEKPAAPSIKNAEGTAAWNPGRVVFDAEGTSFTISGETNAEIEYSLDNGADGSWIPYTGKVSLINDGRYDVVARQTDKAGNVSSNSTVKTVSVNKGKLLTRLSATTVNGTYSTETHSSEETKCVIHGIVQFREEVELTKGVSVTLNVKNKNDFSDGYRKCSLNECKNNAVSSKIFTFDYEIKDGDGIYDDENNIIPDGLLDVTSWTISSVKLDGVDVRVSFPNESIADEKEMLFNQNRSIKIVTGKPEATLEIKENATTKVNQLIVTFDRSVKKVSGDIKIDWWEDSTKQTNAYHVPTVISVEEYNELDSYLSRYNESQTNASLKINEVGGIGYFYKEGMNGATLSGSTLKNDSTTKYILDFDIDDTNEKLVALYKAKGFYGVTIPLISKEVSIKDNVLTVNLVDSYSLPVKGAIYNVQLPKNLVTDAVKNKNALIEAKVTTDGIETPEIRLYKPKYTMGKVGASWSGTTSVTIDMSSAQTAKYRIDCLTPDATITQNNVASVTNGDKINKVNTSPVVTAVTPTVNPSPNKNPSGNYPVVNGGVTNYKIELGAGNKVDSYDNACGLKFAISAKAVKNGKSSDVVYEYATRTVLKFKIDGNYDNNGGSYNTDTSVTESGTKLKFKDLKMWIVGGDSAYGKNSTDPFPFSWDDNKNFKIMQGSHSSNNNMNGSWWYVTWDLVVPAYHGFVIGDAPSDVVENGPTFWYAGECAWAALKPSYILYPGETLIMALDGGKTHTTYLFRYKNEGKRKS